MLQKYHTKWTCQNGTCFTNISSVLKLEKNPQGKWLTKMSQILWRWIIWIGEGLEKVSAIMEQDKIHLLHKLKFLTETKNCSCAHIDQLNELNLGGG